MPSKSILYVVQYTLRSSPYRHIHFSFDFIILGRITSDTAEQRVNSVNLTSFHFCRHSLFFHLSTTARTLNRTLCRHVIWFLTIFLFSIRDCVNLLHFGILVQMPEWMATLSFMHVCVCVWYWVRVCDSWGLPDWFHVKRSHKSSGGKEKRRCWALRFMLCTNTSHIHRQIQSDTTIALSIAKAANCYRNSIAWTRERTEYWRFVRETLNSEQLVE